MVWCIFFFNDVWRHNPPLAILQVLPLIRAILANSEAGFEYIAICRSTISGIVSLPPNQAEMNLRVLCRSQHFR